ncbi:TonB-dependent receptor plug domain-containing protein [Sphingobacterium sp. LRF_L2]|uniref:TonB-dependent receptor plug domain-containing protein n=1 Tax=Sphingobacterium sp. LRF_L2 TaxID=3369421 RepID=UPI003F63C473
MRQKSLLPLFLLFLTAQLLFAQSGDKRIEPDFGLHSGLMPLRVIDKEMLLGLSVNNLAEALRFELNLELELAPEIGGARTRAFDLNSRYTKILLNGVPLSGSDMFGGHVDLSSIPMNRVERIEISNAPLGVAYGSGTLSGVINVVTRADTVQVGTSAYAGVYEQSLASEYNLKKNYGAKGRHVQQFGIQHQTRKGLLFGMDLQRDVFKGVWGEYQGNLRQEGYTHSRGYEWSPNNTLNAQVFFGYANDKLSIYYQYAMYDRDLTVYGHINNLDYRDNDYLDFYTVTDHKNQYRRQLHHSQLKTLLWRDATLIIDLSYQNADTRKRNDWVRTADNIPLEKSPEITLYDTETWHSKGRLEKPIVANKLNWTVGYELDWTKAHIADEPGTYTTQEINHNMRHISGFTYLRWNPIRFITIQPALRVAHHRTISYTDPLPSISIAYNKGKHHLGLIGEKVNRLPNQRELFTYLDSEFNLLEGNTNLRPEHGTSVLADWNYHLLAKGNLQLQTNISSAYRQLKDRIVITAVPQLDAQQERYQYSNSQSHKSWSNKIEVKAATHRWRIQTAYSLLGLRGNDFSDSERYDRYLFHSEVALLGRYNLPKNSWVQLNYRCVGRQSTYSFERAYGSTEINRIHNDAPSYHLADLHIGTSLLNQRLNLVLTGNNLLDSKSVHFQATDGQEHYSGDLRTIYTGYGRSFCFRASYQL